MDSLYSFVINLINALIRGVGKVLSVLLGFLPNSPFTGFLNSDTVKDFLGYVNYFVPVGKMIAILTLWVGAIAVVYIVQIPLRWTKGME